jgi:hypothetical protein
VTVSVSLLCTTHPAGTVTDSPVFDAVETPVDAGLGDGELLGVWPGEPAGLGLGTIGSEMPVVFVWLAALWPISASAVPQPTMTTRRTATAPTISTHGVRCTIGCGPTALAA